MTNDAEQGYRTKKIGEKKKLLKYLKLHNKTLR